ncbi:MAG TPA: T9SS type A sorting domain-containing protein, partial [Chitinophagaceae bacterium]|nr:T9SS type A sorting domain-containing protein [Chitinophagaceae bacterium]
ISYQPKGLIKRFLNPVQQDVVIQLTSFTSGSGNEWILYDMNGKIVHRELFTSQTIYGKLPLINSGIYILEVRMGDRMERVKISKLN